MTYIRDLAGLKADDIALVGGKTSAIGELSALRAKGVRTPPGFAVTARAYRDGLTAAGAWPRLRALLDGLGVRDVAELSRRAAAARAIVYEAMGAETIIRPIAEAWRALAAEHGADLSVAVRSSATAEDLPSASFAGQHDSFLAVSGEAATVEACRRCFASIFTDRAIVYRVDNGFDHFAVSLSVAVMKMVRADLAASGVIFTLDTESGFKDVVFVTGAYGLGETLVQGKVQPDEFYVHKPTFAQGYRAVLRRRLGDKAVRMMLKGAGLSARTVERPTPRRDARRYCLTDEEVMSLTAMALAIEEHFGRAMDIEWAKDGPGGDLYILQARPETGAARRGTEEETWRLGGESPVLVSGQSVGERIAAGAVRVITMAADLEAFQPGEVLVARATSPDWEAVMKRAAAIVTDTGGRTCHAAILAREMGVPAIVGTGDATARLKTGRLVTVSCADGRSGRVYDGALPFTVERTPLGDLAPTRTAIMLNLADPDSAFQHARLPVAGVGLARTEFIVSRELGIHPMALAHPERLSRARDRAAVARFGEGFASPADAFVQRFSESVATIAAAFWPRPAVVRLSDFKSNEYAALIGGRDFEPVEANPMLGFRGAARYVHPAYADGFALECRALRRVRQEIGLKNLKIMVPFCRTVGEAAGVIAGLRAQGLIQGEDGLEIWAMCELPNNVIQIDAFAALFDGFSIGSNDLTQMVLGVDRDSATVADVFDERDPGVLEMLRQAVAGARMNHRPVGICGEAPATWPEVARFLIELHIGSISVNPASAVKMMRLAARIEAETPPEPHHAVLLAAVH